MSGYKRDIVMRVVAVNGGEYVYWFSEKLTDLGSHVRCTVNYPRTMTMREDINRIMRPVVYAKRAMVEIEVLITSMADHQFLQEIAEALDDPINYSVYLSLDGGVVEREVVWGSDSGIPPMPIRGKTVVGATFNLSLQTKEPIGVRGPMMTDPAVGMEHVQDGGMENWLTASTLNSWTLTASAVLAQEATIISAGTYSAKVTRDDGVSTRIFQGSKINTLRKAHWYRFTGKVRGTAVMSNAVRAIIFNEQSATSVASDGFTWSAAGQLILKASIVGSFDSLDIYFRLPSTHVDTDNIYPRLSGFWTTSESLYYDEISITGPVLRTGYATW